MKMNNNNQLSKTNKKKNGVIYFYICFSIPFISVFILLILYGRMIMEHNNNNNNQYEQPNKSKMKQMTEAVKSKYDSLSTNDKKILETFQQEEEQYRPDDEDNHNVKYHIVFSTGCSLYQDWQSYLFFYQIMISKQIGTITRIVSGCNEAEQQTLQNIFDVQIKTMLQYNNNINHNYNTIFDIHFTPDYSHVHGKQSSYVYFNKPYGMKHWMENKLGFPNDVTTENNNSIIILMDPDQLMMRSYDNNDFSNTEWKFIPNHIKPRYNIAHGYPMGQLYGFSIQWKQKVNITLILQQLNYTNITSSVTTMSNHDAQRGYIVGPPYIATGYDMYQIVNLWSQFVVPTYEQYPHLLAEMYAYCLASAHLLLSHQTAISFMVSDVGSGSKAEGWSYIDKISNDDICNTIVPQDKLSHVHSDELPNVLHYCQRYGIGLYFFGKRRIPKNLMSCNSSLLIEPPNNVYDLHKDAIYPNDPNPKVYNTEQRKRHTFIVCYIIPTLNNALTFYKQQHCIQPDTNNENINERENEVANYRKELYLGDVPIAEHG